MKFTTFSGRNFDGLALTQKDSRIFCAIFSVDLQQSHNVSQTAVELVYVHALLSGAGKYSREEFLDAINLLGATLDINITNSRLSIYLRSTAINAPALISLFELMMQKPLFASREIKRIQTLVKNELIEYEENAKSLALDNFVNQLYEKQDRRCADASKAISKHLRTVTTSELKKLHTRVITSQFKVTVGSNSKTIERVWNGMSTWLRTTKTTTVKQFHKVKTQKKAITLHNVPSKHNIEFSIGSSLPLTLQHPDYVSLIFGLSVLGKWGGFAGRLMSTVREKEGLTYGIYARTETVMSTEAGYWRIMTFFSPEQSVQGLQSTLREVRKISKSGITEKEFKNFKIILKTQQDLLADSLTRMVDNYHSGFSAGLTLDEIETLNKRLLEVTQNDVNKALKAYLEPKSLVISGAGPIQSVSKKLSAIRI